MRTNTSKSLDNINIHLGSSKGFTLIELLVALIVGTIILSVGAYGTNILYRTENKSSRADNARNEISRALAYIQNEINNAISVEVETGTDCNKFADAGSSCLKISNSDGSTTLYGFRDIKDITTSNTLYKWLKPGLLRRKYKPSEDDDYGSARVLVDGLAVTNITTPTCDYGTNINNAKGFQFCLGPAEDIDGDGNNEIRGVQVFLFGYAGPGSGDTPIELNNINVAKSIPTSSPNP